MEADLRTVSRNRLAEKITGGLSITEKMPCPSWGIPARRCQLGSVLAQKEGTVCSGCYALKGRYRFGAVQRKLEGRYQGLQHELWTPSMIHLVNWYCDKYFRLFDSGDLQSENHLLNIIEMARHTPDVKIWMPTREAGIVRSVRERIGEFPVNLTARLSGHYIDGPPPDWPTVSSVHTDAHETAPPGSFVCPSREQGNRCLGCRACWEEDHTVYTLH